MKRNDKNSSENPFDASETNIFQHSNADSISALVANLEASLSLYKTENSKLKEQLEEFRESNFILRKENIRLQMRLSSLENSKELKASLEHADRKDLSQTPEQDRTLITHARHETPENGKIMPRRARKSATIKIHSDTQRVQQIPRELSPKVSQSHIGNDTKDHIKTQRENKKTNKRYNSSKYMPSFMRNYKA